MYMTINDMQYQPILRTYIEVYLKKNAMPWRAEPLQSRGEHWSWKEKKKGGLWLLALSTYVCIFSFCVPPKRWVTPCRPFLVLFEHQYSQYD